NELIELFVVVSGALQAVVLDLEKVELETALLSIGKKLGKAPFFLGDSGEIALDRTFDVAHFGEERIARRLQPRLDGRDLGVPEPLALSEQSVPLAQLVFVTPA